MALLPLCPSLVAVIVAVPSRSPLTRPPADTVATAALLVAHITTRPVRGLPFASFGVAVSCTVCPAATLAGAGVTVTEATGATVTVTVAVPLFPSLVAVSVAVPGATALTSPVADTVATPAALVVHVTARPVNTLPAESLGVAVSCTVCPTVRLDEVGLTVTDATGTMVTVTVAVPLFPSLVAVSVAAPAATPVTRPLRDTVATPAALLTHETTRPATAL